MSQNNKLKIVNREFAFPAWFIALLCGVSEDTVRRIRRGERSDESDKGQRVALAETLLPDKINPILQEVSKLVKIDSANKQ